MSIKAEVIRNITPQTFECTVPRVANHVRESVAKIETLPQVMDRAIDSFLNAGSMDIPAKIRFHKMLDGALPKIMQPENFINNGRESKVYRISDKYVAKIRRGKSDNNAISLFCVPSVPNNKFNNLSIYYGEPVAKLGNVEILKNATPGEFVTCGAHWNGSYVKPQDLDRYYNEYLPACSAVSQEGFDEFARDLKDLNGIKERSYSFDKSYTTYGRQPEKIFFKKVSYTPDTFNPNNILISNNRFRIVDQFDKTPVEEPNSLYTMLEPLLVRMTPEAFSKYDAGAVGPRKDIYRKVLIASEKANLPLSNSLIDPSSEYIMLNILNDNKALNIVELLKDMRKQNYPLKDRIAFINKALLPQQ